MASKINKGSSSAPHVESSTLSPYSQKKEIMTIVAQAFTVYEATVWLNTPMDDLGEHTPAEAMKEGAIEDVFRLAQQLKATK